MAPSPEIRPKKKRVEQRVFLEGEEWDDLTDISEFHTGVFEIMGADERVSRNDIVQEFLRWARKEYWKDKGGKPTSAKDRQEKMRKYAERLLSEKPSSKDGE